MNNKEYLALVEQRKLMREPLELQMPSGAVWLCLPISITQFAVSGKLPTGLYGKQNGNGKAKKPTQEELRAAGLQGLMIVKEIMLNNLVFPKISLEESDDAILPEQIDPDDMDYFVKWALAGGQAAQPQNSFPQSSGQ